MKKIVSLFLTLIIAMSLFSSVSVSVNGTSGLNLQQLKEKFPQGAYWNHKANNTHEYSGMDDYGTCNNPDGYTWTPCYSHSAVATAGYYDCNSFRGAMQCCGFAKKIAFDVYGSCHDSWGTTDITNCKSGDVVHYYSSQTDQTWGHWLMIIDRNGNIVTVGECNGTANANCQINWTRTMSISDFGWNKTCYSAPYELPKNCTSHKWNSGKVTTQPTCKKDGVKTYTCTVCGEKKTETIKHSSKYHNYKVSKCIKATLHTNGKLIKKCTHCGKTVKSTIYRPKTIKLKKTKFVYNGKKKKPAVVVKNTKGKEISSKYYNVTFTGNKKVGKAAAKISFKTRYSGAVKRYFAIIPKGTSLSKLKAGSKSFTAKWKKQTAQTTGYQLQYATNSKFTKGKKTITIKSAKTVSKKIKKLKAGKKYYVRVRTYKKIKKALYPSAWSKAKTVTTFKRKYFTLGGKKVSLELPPNWIAKKTYEYGEHISFYEKYSYNQYKKGNHKYDVSFICALKCETFKTFKDYNFSRNYYCKIGKYYYSMYWLSGYGTSGEKKADKLRQEALDISWSVSETFMPQPKSKLARIKNEYFSYIAADYSKLTEEKAKFSTAYITNDNTPELVIAKGTGTLTYAAEINTINNGRVNNIGEIGRTDLQYYYKRNTISFYSAMLGERRYFNITSSKTVLLGLSKCIDYYTKKVTGYFDYKNGRKISKATFNEKLNKLTKGAKAKSFNFHKVSLSNMNKYLK